MRAGGWPDDCGCCRWQRQRSYTAALLPGAYYHHHCWRVTLDVRDGGNSIIRHDAGCRRLRDTRLCIQDEQNTFFAAAKQRAAALFL